jgi:hypothetical protein
MSVFLDFFCLIAFSGVSRLFLSCCSDVSSKTPQKTFLQKNRQKKSKTAFFSIVVYHVFGRFSVRGVQKHDKKSQKKI